MEYLHRGEISRKQIKASQFCLFSYSKGHTGLDFLGNVQYLIHKSGFFRRKKINVRCVYQIAQIKKYLWPRKKCVYLIVTFVQHHVVNVSSILLGNSRPVSNHMVFSRHFWQLQHGTPVQGMFGWQFDTIGLNHPLEGIRRFLIECMRRLE